jgi:ATP-dependent HslUV protease ATP-binding subunit HslU
MLHLTPQQIVQELDKYIVGQTNAKRAVAIALRNRWRRQLLTEEMRDEVIPKNILMIGPTGVGKTEIARRLAKLAAAPFIKVEATKFTEVGYVGRDVDSMVRDLVQTAVRLVEAEKTEEVRPQAEKRAIERLADMLQPNKKTRTAEHHETADAVRQAFSTLFGTITQNPQTQHHNEETTTTPEEQQRENKIRQQLLEDIRLGQYDNKNVQVEVETTTNPFLQIFSTQGVEDMNVSDLQNAFHGANRNKKTRTVTVKEAREILTKEEAAALIDHDTVVREAVTRCEESGIIFIDELDKIAGKDRGSGPDVSREGVQRDLLPIIEGSTVTTKYGPVRTNHILFIGAGAFHLSKPSDLIPELQGRLPIRVELENLTEQDFVRILTEPKNALTRQYQALLLTEDVHIEFTPQAVSEIAHIASEVNSRSENIGARRLHTLMERLLEEISFNAPQTPHKHITIDADFVRERLHDIAANEDLSRYIL